MIRPSIRIASGVVAALLVGIACFAGTMWWLPATLGILFALPLFTARRAPREDEAGVIAANLARFRNAMLLTFFGSCLSYLVAMTGLRTWRESAAALGVSLWLVSFLLMFPAAYYASRRALLSRDYVAIPTVCRIVCGSLMACSM